MCSRATSTCAHTNCNSSMKQGSRLAIASRGDRNWNECKWGTLASIRDASIRTHSGLGKIGIITNISTAINPQRCIADCQMGVDPVAGDTTSGGWTYNLAVSSSHDSHRTRQARDMGWLPLGIHFQRGMDFTLQVSWYRGAIMSAGSSICGMMSFSGLSWAQVGILKQFLKTVFA